MADTLNLPVNRIRAVLQECSRISLLEMEGIMVRLRAHDVTPVCPERTSTYVLVNARTPFAFPEPSVHRGFDRLRWDGDPVLPYELQEEVSIPHMVVVTGGPCAAMRFFNLLLSQKGLQIGALEFLILANCKDASGVYYDDLPNDHNGCLLGKWYMGSNSIKIVREPTTFFYQLKRHVHHVLRHNYLHNLRDLSDRDRVQLYRKDELSPFERERLMARLTVARPELTVTYVLVNAHTSFTFPKPTVHCGFDRLRWDGYPELPYELQDRVFIRYMVVVTGGVYGARRFFNLLMSQKGLKIGALEFICLAKCTDARGDYVDLPDDLKASKLMQWSRGSRSINIVPEESTVACQLKRHVRFVVKRQGLRRIRGLTDRERAELDEKREY